MDPKCLVENCNQRPAVNCRGLCLKCFSQAKKTVAAGRTTWEQLEELGMVKPQPSKFEQDFLKRKGGG